MKVFNPFPLKKINKYVIWKEKKRIPNVIVWISWTTMERLYCLLVTDFLLLNQLFVIPRAFIIILDAVDKLLCINTIISQENFIVTRALNIILDAVDIISCMHSVI